ncbi:MAG TPA: FHA domain-containing protein [Longimicrobiales bacterium]|nr:FHA domain-containing protein [Longimicrobiales bacterium]
MPKLTLLIGRKAMQVYDLDKETILIGREDDVDIVIDNPSVSRKHAQIRKEGAGWVVEDLGSSNGTFLHGEKISAAQPVKEGDEIGFGKFSVVFGKAVGDAVDQASAKPAAKPAATDATGGTMQIKSHEVKELLKESERKRRAHLQWESGGRKGTHFLSDAPAVVFGTDELCDVKVPSGPKHALLIIKVKDGFEARNLGGMFDGMKVAGKSTKRAALKDGDVVQMGGLVVNYVADIA